MEHKELHRLLSAAIADEGFRRRLLENPLEAVRVGYFGQSFSLTGEERELLASIRVSDFPTFSEQIHQWISRNEHQGRTEYFSNDEEF